MGGDLVGELHQMRGHVMGISLCDFAQTRLHVATKP